MFRQIEVCFGLVGCGNYLLIARERRRAGLWSRPNVEELEQIGGGFLRGDGGHGLFVSLVY